MLRKSIYVCYPFSDDPVQRTVRVRYLTRALELQGYLPLSVHLYWPQIMQVGVPKKEADGPIRDRVMECCTQMVGWCDELWVFGDKLDEDGWPELISEGMQMEIDEAIDLGIPVIGKSMHDFVPGLILAEGRDLFVNLGLDLMMSSIANDRGGWSLKVMTSSPHLGQNMFTIAQGLIILLNTTLGKERVDEGVEEFITTLEHVREVNTKMEFKSEMM